MTACIICSNTINNQNFQLKELQLGLAETFNYQLCGSCGSMQLLNPPPDFTAYYPNEDYYSFTDRVNLNKAGSLRKIKSEYLLYGKHKVLGSLLSIGYKLPEYAEWMQKTNAGLHDHIL